MPFQANFARLFRLGLLAAAICLIRSRAPQSPPVVLTVDRVREFYPAAVSISGADGGGVQTVKDSSGIALGYLAQTSPGADAIVGYSGPTNTLLALDPAGRVLGVRVLHSADTPEHVAEVVAKRSFFAQFKGLKIGDVGGIKAPDAVSGATLTANAIAAGILNRLGSPTTSLRFPNAITLDEVRALIPDAARLDGEKVFNASGQLVGRAIRTSPASDSTIGYKGPSDTLVILDPTGTKVTNVRLRTSFDTETYVGYVTGDPQFLRLFSNMPVQKLASLDFAKEGVEGVSGATETSYAIAEGLKLRAKAHMDASIPKWLSALRWRWQDTGHLAVIFSALAMAFTKLRGSRTARTIHHILLVAYGGLIASELLSQALFVGWARGALPWQSAPGLVLLAAVALLGPVFTRRQIYCHHICPHGALQQLVARRLPWQWQPGQRMLRVLGALPYALLVFVLVAAVLGWTFNLNALEPFDAYVFRVAGVGTLAVFLVGILASLFSPMAYCRHGCPTGALFTLLRATGQKDKLSRRDYLAAALIVLLFLTGCQPSAGQYNGACMGSTWKVQLASAAPSTLGALVQEELDRIEATFSHYRADSVVSQFNRWHSTEPFAVPAEVAELVEHLRTVSTECHGVLDPTLAPVVELWGFGKSGPVQRAPDLGLLKLAGTHVGLSKLTASVSPSYLQKADPELQINLSCIVEGYALQRIDELLARHGSRSHLIEISGEIFARGAGWNVGIGMPDPRAASGTMATSLPLKDACLATSGSYRQLFSAAGERYSHLIDPRTLSPIHHSLRSVSVVHENPILADAYATGLMVLGPEEGRTVASALKLNAVFLEESASGLPEPAHAPSGE